MFENYKKSRSLRKQTKLFEDEKFDIDEEGRGIIEIGAGDYSDIFSYYSLNNYNVLDSEFNAFLETKADAIPMKHELTLNFHVKEPDEAKEQEIKFALKENYEREIHAINRKMHRNNIFSLYMLLMGFLFFVVYITIVHFNLYFAIKVIFEIATWVFFWEAVDSFFLERRHLKIERLKKYRLLKSKIVLSEFVIKTFGKQGGEKKHLAKNKNNENEQNSKK